MTKNSNKRQIFRWRVHYLSHVYKFRIVGVVVCISSMSMLLLHLCFAPCAPHTKGVRTGKRSWLITFPLHVWDVPWCTLNPKLHTYIQSQTLYTAWGYIMPEDRSYTHPDVFSKPEDTHSQREDIHNQRFFHSQRIHKARGRMYRTRGFFTARLCTQPKYIRSQVSHTYSTYKFVYYIYLQCTFCVVSLKSKAPAIIIK